MKKNIRKEAYKILYEVLYNNGYSNILLQKRLADYSKEDKALITNIVYGTLQNYDLLRYQLNNEKIDRKSLVIILMSLYQKYFLDKIPDYAIISEALKLSKEVSSRQQAQFINAILKQTFSKELEYAHTDDYLKDLAINYSHPLWLVKMINKQYGEEVLVKYLQENNASSKIHLRYNVLSKAEEKVSADPLVKEFEDNNLIIDNAYLYLGKDIANFDLYLEGIMSVQDLSSQQVGYFLNPKPFDKVLDMCAAPGSKTSHLAEIMNNQGEIKAYDLHEHKIGLINNQAKRLGIDIIKAESYDATKLLEKEEVNSFDRILCDAPCTGLGVIKRKPEIKFQDISTSMDSIIAIQEQLLQQAYLLLKPGGTLVYSTCTINKKENEKQIEKLLSEHDDLKLIEEKNIFNFESHGDCFYMAKLVKNSVI